MLSRGVFRPAFILTETARDLKVVADRLDHLERRFGVAAPGLSGVDAAADDLQGGDP